MPPIDVAFIVFPVVTTNRLFLRQIQQTDAKDLFEIFCDAETMKFNGHPQQHSLDDTHEWIKEIHTRYTRRESFRWGVTLRETDKLIGTCSFHRFDTYYRRVELGYEMNRAYWGKGIMAEAVSALLRYGFNDLQLHRIEAVIDINNERSKALLERLGFTYEGVLRQRYFTKDDIFADEYYFGLLKSEWDSGKQP